MGQGFLNIQSLPAVSSPINGLPIHEIAEIETSLDDVLSRKVVYVIGMEDREPASPSGQPFRVHFYNELLEGGSGRPSSYDYTRGPITNYEVLEKSPKSF